MRLFSSCRNTDASLCVNHVIDRRQQYSICIGRERGYWIGSEPMQVVTVDVVCVRVQCSKLSL